MLRSRLGSLRAPRLAPVLHRTADIHSTSASSQIPLLRSSTQLPKPCQRECLSQFSTSSRAAAPRYVRFNPDPKAPFDYRKWDFGTRVVVGLVAFGSVYFVTHLEQVPETGRWRFMDISPKYEAKLAEASRQEILEQFGHNILPENHPLTQHVKRVVTRILEASNLGTLKDSPTQMQRVSSFFQFSPGSGSSKSSDGGGGGEGIWDPDSQPSKSSGPTYPTDTPDGAPTGTPREWTVLVVNDKLVNAMAGPGTVVVFTGILPICKDEAGLASVLSHEIGHVVARHVPESYSSSKVFLGLALLLETLGLDFGISRLLTTYLLQLPNSRTHEREADVIGLKMMSKACYDPKAAPEMFNRLGEYEKKARGRSIEFLGTHPNSESRVKYLEELLPEAYAIQAASPDCANVLGEAMSVFRGNVMGGVRKKEGIDWE